MTATTAVSGPDGGRVDPQQREGGHDEGGQEPGPLPHQVPHGHAGHDDRPHEQDGQEDHVGGRSGGVGHVGDGQQDGGQRWMGGRGHEGCARRGGRHRVDEPVPRARSSRACTVSYRPAGGRAVRRDRRG